MPNFDPFAGGASAVQNAFGMRSMPMSLEDRYNQMQEAGQQRRMSQMVGMGGYGGSMGGSMGGGSFGGSMGGTPWYRSIPNYQFPQGGMG